MGRGRGRRYNIFRSFADGSGTSNTLIDSFEIFSLQEDEVTPTAIGDVLSTNFINENNRARLEYQVGRYSFGLRDVDGDITNGFQSNGFQFEELNIDIDRALNDLDYILQEDLIGRARISEDAIDIDIDIDNGQEFVSFTSEDLSDLILPVAGETISGSDVNDTLNGGSGNDLIDGGARDDVLNGNDGDDTLLGGNGQDTLDGGIGNDSLDAGASDDQLLGQDGNDTLLGGNGQDTLDGGIGDDSLDAGASDDQLLGQDGNDTLLGNAGRDTLSGGIGNDLLDGGSSNDQLLGQEGNDTLLGGVGSDTLDGGIGDDFITGGSSQDTFVLSSEAGTDVITDFGTGNDVIGLSGGLTFADLSFTGNDIIFGDETLATLNGFDTTSLTEGDFVTV